MDVEETDSSGAKTRGEHCDDEARLVFLECGSLGDDSVDPLTDRATERVRVNGKEWSPDDIKLVSTMLKVPALRPGDGGGASSGFCCVICRRNFKCILESIQAMMSLRYVAIIPGESC